MGVTLTDPNILVNLPHFLGKGAGQCFFQLNRGINVSRLGKAKLGLGNKKYKVKGLKLFYLGF